MVSGLAPKARRSTEAYGNAPGFWFQEALALKARFKGWFHQLRRSSGSIGATGLKRSFSAWSYGNLDPEAMPQAEMGQRLWR
jgi:hypothetical protein